MTIVEFVLARYDEREQAALRWREDERRWQVVGGRRLRYDNGAHEDVMAIDVSNRSALWWERIYVKRDLDGLSQHIALNDPAYVLDDLAAKREMVKLHAPAGRLYEDGPYYCSECGSGEPHEYPTEWPCRTLRLLAVPFAGHPDYDPAWAPS